MTNIRYGHLLENSGHSENLAPACGGLIWTWQIWRRRKNGFKQRLYCLWFQVNASTAGGAEGRCVSRQSCSKSEQAVTSTHIKSAAPDDTICNSFLCVVLWTTCIANYSIVEQSLLMLHLSIAWTWLLQTLLLSDGSATRRTGIPVTGVSNGMEGGADLPRPGSRLQNAASGLNIALVIQIPEITALGGIGEGSRRKRRKSKWEGEEWGGA